LLVASLTYLAGFAALIHATARLCLARKRSSSSALYVSLAIATMGYAVYRAGDGLQTEARWAFAFIPVVTVSLALLSWIPTMLDLRRLGAGGRVSLRLPDPQQPGAGPGRNGLFLIVFVLVVVPWEFLSPSKLRAAAALGMEAESALAAAATLCLGGALAMSFWMQGARLRPSALLEQGLWLDGGPSGRWSNWEQMQLVPWDAVISYAWRAEEAATVEVKVSSWTGSTSLHLLRVPVEQKELVDETLQRHAPGRRVAVPA